MDLSLFRSEITVVFSLQFTLEKKSFEPMSPNVAVLHVIKPFRSTIMYFTRVVLLNLRLITTCVNISEIILLLQ